MDCSTGRLLPAIAKDAAEPITQQVIPIIRNNNPKRDSASPLPLSLRLPCTTIIPNKNVSSPIGIKIEERVAKLALANTALIVAWALAGSAESIMAPPGDKKKNTSAKNGPIMTAKPPNLFTDIVPITISLNSKQDIRAAEQLVHQID
tara:strand:+ start:12349 stop:12792 length:444 start_codon:yes stop_codon:yes gene_type:complete